MSLLVLLKQDFKNLATNPITFTFCFIYPPALVFLFGFLFSYLYGTEQVTSYDFYGVTMMFYMLLGTITITPNTFMEKRIKAANVRIAYAPIPRAEIYASKLLSSFLFMGIMFTIDMVVMQLVGFVNYGTQQFGTVLLLMYAMLAFSITLGGAVCVVLRSEELTNKILTIVATAFAVFSGVFFPIAGLGEWANLLSNCSPLKWVIDCAFQLIYDGKSDSFIPLTMGLLGCSAIFIVIIHYRYHPEDYIQ